MMIIFDVQYVYGHVHVYDGNGKFLFSADNEQEARKEIMEYAQSAT